MDSFSSTLHPFQNKIHSPVKDEIHSLALCVCMKHSTCVFPAKVCFRLCAEHFMQTTSVRSLGEAVGQGLWVKDLLVVGSWGFKMPPRDWFTPTPDGRAALRNQKQHLKHDKWWWWPNFQTSRLHSAVSMRKGVQQFVVCVWMCCMCLQMWDQLQLDRSLRLLCFF